MKKGTTLLEVLISLAILGILMGSFFPTVAFLTRQSRKFQYDSEASSVLQEGMEIAYNVFLTNWNAVSDTGTYHPVLNASVDPNIWGLEPDEKMVRSRYTRKIEVFRVCRNLSSGQQKTGECISGNDYDLNSRLIKTTVIWKENQVDREIASELLITRLPDNL